MPGLDALRGLAIVLVLIHNLSFAENVHSRLFKLWNVLPESGWIGVQIFFVLSGFLITGILVDDRGLPAVLREVLRPSGSSHISAVLRAAHPLRRPLRNGCARVPDRTPEAISYATYLQNWSSLFLEDQPPGFGPLWSLAVEEQFYLLWPLLIGKVSLRASTIACVAIIVASFLARMGMHLATCLRVGCTYRHRRARTPWPSVRCSRCCCGPPRGDRASSARFPGWAPYPLSPSRVALTRMGSTG